MMGPKKNLLSHKKNLFLSFLTISLISCSALGQWWYDRLDIYLANYFFKYADFSNEQKSYVRSVTKDYLEWNSSSEIPKYRNLILKIRDLDTTTTTEDIERIFEEGESLFEASNNFFTPHIVRFCKTVFSSDSKNIPKASYDTFTKYSALLKVVSRALYFFINFKVSSKSFFSLSFFLKVFVKKALSIEFAF